MCADVCSWYGPNTLFKFCSGTTCPLARPGQACSKANPRGMQCNFLLALRSHTFIQGCRESWGIAPQLLSSTLLHPPWFRASMQAVDPTHLARVCMLSLTSACPHENLIRNMPQMQTSALMTPRRVVWPARLRVEYAQAWLQARSAELEVRTKYTVSP